MTLGISRRRGVPSRTRPWRWCLGTVLALVVFSVTGVADAAAQEPGVDPASDVLGALDAAGVDTSGVRDAVAPAGDPAPPAQPAAPAQAPSPPQPEAPASAPESASSPAPSYAPAPKADTK